MVMILLMNGWLNANQSRNNTETEFYCRSSLLFGLARGSHGVGVEQFNRISSLIFKLINFCHCNYMQTVKVYFCSYSGKFSNDFSSLAAHSTQKEGTKLELGSSPEFENLCNYLHTSCCVKWYLPMNPYYFNLKCHEHN
jgi:hypothetical protein